MPGSIRRISIDNLSVYNADPEYASIISGIPGHEIEDVSLSNIRIHTKGGGTAEQAALVLPENEKSYPEPSMFGVTPAYGFFIRHAKGVRMSNVKLDFAADDLRPAFVIEKAADVSFSNIHARKMDGGLTFALKDVEKFTSQGCPDLEDRKTGDIPDGKF